jgi:glucokinase
MVAAVSVVGVDVGGTRVKAALFDSRARTVRRATASTPSGPPGPVIERLAALILGLRGSHRVRAVGVGFCGMVDHRRGVVLETTETLPGWRDVPLARELASRVGVPCVIDNDANLAALGEATLGAGRGADPVVAFTLGTGVGGGIVIDGELLRGAGGMAANLGHLGVRPNGRRCACGARGCLEAYASAWALRRRLGLDAREVFRRARRGDGRCRRALDDAADALGRAFADVANAINPEVIVVGGGLSRGLSRLRPGMLRAYEARALPVAGATTRIVRARYPLDAGVLGAAALARALPR